MATADLSLVFKENTNFYRLCRLLIDGGTQVLREVFDSIHKPLYLNSNLLDPRNHRILNNLRHKRILFQEQWDKLYPARGLAISTSFDITLLCLLLRSICNLRTPSSGNWNTLPSPSSTSTEDDIVRIKLYRNNLYGHIKEASLSDSDFTKHWDDLKTVLVRLGGPHYEVIINKLRIASMDPEDGKNAVKCLDEWVRNEDKIMKALEEMEEKLVKLQHEEAEETRENVNKKIDQSQWQVTAKIDEIQQHLDGKIDQMKSMKHEEEEKTRENVNKKIDWSHILITTRIDENQQQVTAKMDEIHQHLVGKIDQIKRPAEQIVERQQKHLKKDPVMPNYSGGNLSDIGLNSKHLKSSILEETKFQPKLMADHDVSESKTDDIFTNLTIQRGRKCFRDRSNISRWEYSQPNDIPIKTCQEIFKHTDKDTPTVKSALVVGKPGIGKSLFCQKFVRDWANDIFFKDEFDFVYLLTFRQLNQLRENRVEYSLREVLNKSPLLDKSSSIEDSQWEYMCKHQSKVLFILDGYDEYVCPEEISDTNFQNQNENNEDKPMPISILFSKLMRKKIFKDSTVMVTSRPREADMLGEINFNAKVEILGFSPEQVREFIEKYFQLKDKEIMNVVVQHVMGNPHLLSAAHIPMQCALMCYCLKFYIDNGKEIVTTDLPVTMTELYSEIVKLFELKHNSKSDFRGRGIPVGHFEVPQKVEITMKNLSKLAGETLMKTQYIFKESDWKQFGISCEEVDSLQASGLLTWTPGLRETPSMKTRDICFSHLTFHEYFAALQFVRDNIIPVPNDVSEMVIQFMAGALAKERNDKLMEKLLDNYLDMGENLRAAKCLYEYQDKEFGIRMIKKYHDCGLLNKTTRIHYQVSDSDSVAVSFFFNLMNEVFKGNAEVEEHQATNSHLSTTATGLEFEFNVDTMNGAKRICDSLKEKFCPISSLSLRSHFEYVCQELPSTNITSLHISNQFITESGLQCLSQVLPSTKITTLDLSNRGFNTSGFHFLSQALPSTNITFFDYSEKEITESVMQYLSQALQSTKITTLDLSNNTIIDSGFQYLMQALPSTNITTLDLSGMEFGDNEFQYLTQALPSTKITTLNLSDGDIHNSGLRYLSQALPSTQITTLNLASNYINDSGLQFLIQAIPSTNITTLDLSNNDITERGLQKLSEVSPSTKITFDEASWSLNSYSFH